VSFLLGYLVGTFLGTLLSGGFFIYLLTLLIGRLFFKSAEPDKKAIASVGIAWILVSILIGLGMARGGPFRWDATLNLVPSAIVVWLYRRYELRRAWNSDSDIFE
jgi:hypothetical protein